MKADNKFRVSIATVYAEECVCIIQMHGRKVKVFFFISLCSLIACKNLQKPIDEYVEY